MYKGKQKTKIFKLVPIQPCTFHEINDHILRFKTIELFCKILNEFKSNGVEGLQKEAQTFVDELKAMKSDSEFIHALIDTIDRQVVTMLTKIKYVEKWGEHQLRHLIRSLEMQVKGNFREQCLKDFGGTMFNNLADTADDIYNTMEPPKASLAIKAQAAKIQNAQDFA